MFNSESVGKKCGYLDVKVPSKVRGKGIKAWKAWKKRWVVVHGMTNLSTKCPVVTIDMYSHENREGHQLERSTIYLEDVKSICRTRSKSHLYAFGIEAQQTLLYLSGCSETESQHWIAAFKHILCPRTTVPALHASVGQVFGATIIESLSYCANRLNGTVGYIIALPSVVLLAGLDDGCILAEWPLTTIQHVSVVRDVPHHDDKNKILTMEISNDVSNGGLFHFFSDVAVAIESILSRNTSTWRTSMSTWRTQAPIQLRKNSEDVTGGAKRTDNTEHRLTTKALSAENLHVATRNFPSYRPLPSRPTSDYKKEKNEEDGAAPTVVQRRNSPATVKQRHVRSCNDLYMQQDMEKTSQVARRKCTSDPTLMGQTDRRISPATHDLSSHKAILTRETAIVEGSTPREDTSTAAITNTQNEKHFLQIAQTRPLSVYSSTSQASRDSGVMLSAPDEGLDNNGHRHLQKADTSEATTASTASDGSKITDVKRWSFDDTDSVAYRHFSEFIQGTEQMALYQNQGDRLSTSSDSTLYSEIDTFSDLRNDGDPLYEDLDKFRKNIHKLLGIPQNVGVNPLKPTGDQTAKGTPPPLPPRRYKRGMSRKISEPPIRRKDVMKYLGVDSDKFYGSLDKLPQIDAGRDRATPPGPTKRKDIYRYLGIPAMATSQPAGLNTVAEQTYDSPSSTRQISSNKTASLRKSTRTYVRVSSLHGSAAASSTVTDAKTTKKGRMSFLKRKPSTKDTSDQDRHSRTNSSTYVSYDSCFADDWNCISTTTPCLTGNQIPVSSSQISPSVTAEQESIGLLDQLQAEGMQADVIIEEKDVEEQVLSDEEHYCVPLSLKHAILENTESPSSAPLYVNLAELYAASTKATVELRCTGDPHVDIETAECLEEEKELEDSDVSADSNYMDMSVLSSKRTSPLSSLLVVAQNGAEQGVDNDYKGHRNSVYMEMDFAALVTTSTDSDTEDPSNANIDADAILESVMLCINELQAICNVENLVCPMDNDSDVIPHLEAPGEVETTHGTGRQVSHDSEMKNEVQSSQVAESVSESKESHDAHRDEARLSNEKEDTKVREITRLTSVEIAEMVNRTSLDEEAATMLRQRLSSYIDQLFAPSHAIEDAVTSDNESSLDANVSCNNNNERSESDPETLKKSS